MSVGGIEEGWLGLVGFSSSELEESDFAYLNVIHAYKTTKHTVIGIFSGIAAATTVDFGAESLEALFRSPKINTHVIAKIRL